MPIHSHTRLWKLSLLLIAAAAIGVFLLCAPHPPPPAPPPAATTIPTSAPTSVPSVAPPVAAVTRTYAQLLTAEFPNNPPGAALPASLDLSDAAHLIIPRRVYLCARGDLWIARPDADPLPTVLARAAGESEHIANRDVEYVLWTVNSKGDQIAQAVCRSGNGFELVSTTGTQPIPWRRNYHWESAMDWDDNGVTRMIVPTDDGVSMITVDKQLTESYCALRDSGSGPPPQVLFDLRGILAWIPADVDADANTSVARFVDGHWTKLDPAAWPVTIIHLVPMLDGSVLQIRRGADPQSVQLTIEPLDSPAIDENQIGTLVTQLDDPDPDKRTAAFERLTEYGPGIFPILEKLEGNASPTAQPRIEQLLQGKVETRLAGMEIEGDQLTVTARLSDGGVVFNAPQGITLPRDQKSPQLINPAYLVLRPGRPVQLLPGGLAGKIDATTQLSAYHDEWVATQAPRGPMRFLPPDQLTPLLRPSEMNFSQWVGMDSRGRWIFRTANADHPTLILDPTIPDPSPRLAVWMIDSGTAVGWNPAGWPVVQRGSDRWMLSDHDWELLAPADVMQTKSPPPADVLMTDSTGNQYLDGRSTLTVVRPSRRKDIWNLSDEAAGTDDFRPWLVAVGQGRLLLFNANGRIVRLRPNGDQTFSVEAIFNHGLGMLRSLDRVWTDPAGRVAVAFGDNQLAIIFPDGRVDPQIADQILPQDLKRIDPQ